MQFTGQTMSALQDSLKESAAKSIKGRLALEAVAKAENLEVTAEDLEKEYQQMAESYNMEVEKIKEVVPEEEVKDTLLNRKALSLVTEAAKFI